MFPDALMRIHASVFDAYAGTAVHDFLNGLMQFFSLRWVFTLEPLRALFHVNCAGVFIRDDLLSVKSLKLNFIRVKWFHPYQCSWALIVIRRWWWWAFVAVRGRLSMVLMVNRQRSWRAVIAVRRWWCWAPVDIAGRSSPFLERGDQ
ncbi:uncharacterized protein LACBIDRAFT_322666 [Laccaria bicolor S238N-H82]|uniref:Predicted protein n=1 Tax=Laccaria bicolor (strain S238N-H82 / ATCC MYA-4686) TaxID=486041 RepID=B0CX39_LACBS|nr:uncharacterized protein LACBIDRAFT_322666 [Laccaria bicolor S238N-H82]EDR13185.1 predicted protein [Laccaria bicolor S238N-H82]|eukprot:XP_001875683.1 predicted protein [Laccaria bicolor S238N-H82]